MYLVFGLGFVLPTVINIHLYVCRNDRSVLVGYSTERPDTTSHNQTIRVAIGMAITSVGTDVLDKMPLFTSLFPTFCQTASLGYVYSFYLAYDFNDRFFNNQSVLQTWKERFSNFSRYNCSHLGPIEVTLVKCNHSGKPAYAQNDAMMAAYRDGVDFFYRINDDTIMTSSKWTDIFIGELYRMVPPLVGVVGPTHLGGNLAILTYDFVHRTHIDIFGYYYPPEFTTWYADEWITRVYRPTWSKKVTSVTLRHIYSQTQYRVRRVTPKYLDSIIKQSALPLNRYLHRNGEVRAA